MDKLLDRLGDKVLYTFPFFNALADIRGADIKHGHIFNQHVFKQFCRQRSVIRPQKVLVDRFVYVKAGPRNSDEPTDLQNLADVFPCGYLRQHVGADDEIKIHLFPVKLSEMLDRIDRVGLAAAIDLKSRYLKTRITD